MTQNAIAVVGSKNNLKHLMGQAKSSIADIIPKHITAERVLKMSLVAASKTPKLMECTKDSFLKSVMTASECGLDFSGTTGQGYLVPYYSKKLGAHECQFIAGYRGLMDMARRSGKVTRLESRVVYKNDKFKFSYGINQTIEHTPCMTGDRGEIICVYAIAQLSDGSIQSEVMPIEDVEEIRTRSKAKDSGPWKTDYSEMARKTVLRRLCKYIPSSQEMEKLIAADPEVDVEITSGGGFVEMPDNDAIPRTEQLAASIAGNGNIPEDAPQQDNPPISDPENATLNADGNNSVEVDGDSGTEDPPPTTKGVSKRGKGAKKDCPF